jgi:predicted ArsR family transcriptional regulator
MLVTDLDRRIFREYAHEGLYFYASNITSVNDLADRVQAHRNTIVTHIDRLTRNHLLFPWVFDAAPPVVDLASTRLIIQGPSPWRDASLMRRLQLVEGVKSIDEYGPYWGLAIFAESEESLRARITLVLELSRGTIVDQDPAPMPHSSPWATAHPRLLRLMAHIVGSSSLDAGELALKLGVSTRTVHRDYQELCKERLLAHYYGGTVSRPDAMFARFVFPTTERSHDEHAKSLESLLPEHVVRFRAVGATSLVFVILASSTRDLEQVASRVGHERVPFHWRPWTRRATNWSYFNWLRAVLINRARVSPRALSSRGPIGTL